MDVPVVVAGGGLVGMASAVFLARHGVAALVMERMRGGSPLPRAAHFHLRTLELLRAIGVEEDVRGQSELEFVPERAIVSMDSLAGRTLADIIPINPLSPDPPSALRRKRPEQS
jgi:putative polyketide hydroxylase